MKLLRFIMVIAVLAAPATSFSQAPRWIDTTTGDGSFGTFCIDRNSVRRQDGMRYFTAKWCVWRGDGQPDPETTYRLRCPPDFHQAYRMEYKDHESWVEDVYFDDAPAFGAGRYACRLRLAR